MSSLIRYDCYNVCIGAVVLRFIHVFCSQLEAQEPFDECDANVDRSTFLCRETVLHVRVRCPCSRATQEKPRYSRRVRAKDTYDRLPRFRRDDRAGCFDDAISRAPVVAVYLETRDMLQHRLRARLRPVVYRYYVDS